MTIILARILNAETLRYRVKSIMMHHSISFSKVTQQLRNISPHHRWDIWTLTGIKDMWSQLPLTSSFFSSSKIISLNITTNALSSSSIAHKTIFGRPFSNAHTTGIIHVWGNSHIIVPNSWKEKRWARPFTHEHSRICRHTNTKTYTHSLKPKIA